MKVKIFLEGNETIQDAEEALSKALEFHKLGEVHVNESFEDPAMEDVENRLEVLFNKMYQEMLQEVSEALDEEYQNGYE